MKVSLFDLFDAKKTSCKQVTAYFPQLQHTALRKLVYVTDNITNYFTENNNNNNKNSC